MKVPDEPRVLTARRRPQLYPEPVTASPNRRTRATLRQQPQSQLPSQAQQQQPQLQAKPQTQQSLQQSGSASNVKNQAASAGRRPTSPSSPAAGSRSRASPRPSPSLKDLADAAPAARCAGANTGSAQGSCSDGARGPESQNDVRNIPCLDKAASNASGSADYMRDSDSNCAMIADAALLKSAQLIQELTNLTLSDEELRGPSLSSRSEIEESPRVPSRIISPPMSARATWPSPGRMQSEVAKEMAEIWRALRDLEQRLDHKHEGATNVPPQIASCSSLASAAPDRALPSGPATPMSTMSNKSHSALSLNASRTSMPWSVGSTLTPQQSFRGSISVASEGVASCGTSSVSSLYTSPRTSLGARTLQYGATLQTQGGLRHSSPQHHQSDTQLRELPRQSSCVMSPAQPLSTSSSRTTLLRVQSKPQVVWQPVMVTKVHQYLAWAPGQNAAQGAANSNFVAAAAQPAIP